MVEKDTGFTVHDFDNMNASPCCFSDMCKACIFPLRGIENTLYLNGGKFICSTNFLTTSKVDVATGVYSNFPKGKECKLG